MTRRVTIFFYGLFMDPQALEVKGLKPMNVRRARVERFALKIGDRATLVPDKDASVYGTIASLTYDEIDRLYSEPSVVDYRAEPVLAQLEDGSAELALCFNLPTMPDGKSTNPDYAAALQAVARRLGLPQAYIESIVA